MLLLSILTYILGLQPLHEAGYKGQGMTIAVIDCGFYNANDSKIFNQERIIGVYDLLKEDSINRPDIFSNPADNHGAHCLSTMLCQSEDFTGTAPEADYILIRTEDLKYEYQGELDRLEKGMRLADELGADIITISLGYSSFDDPSTNYTYADMNGKNRLSQTATELARKGRLICVAAGNDGNKPWHYIDLPADADSILTVGACSADSLPAPFSSWGPTADGRQKPEVAAWGQLTRIIDLNSGEATTGSGTSYATPEIAGMAACLWQALPGKTAMQIRELIIKSAHQYDSPDYQLGYGIPDAGKAWLAGRTPTAGNAAENDAAENNAGAAKILRNGTIYIIRSGEWYLPTGIKARKE